MRGSADLFLFQKISTFVDHSRSWEAYNFRPNFFSKTTNDHDFFLKCQNNNTALHRISWNCENIWKSKDIIMSKIHEQIKKLACASISWYTLLRVKVISPAFTEVYGYNCANNDFQVVVILSQIIPIHIPPNFFTEYFNIILAFMPTLYASLPWQ